MPGRQDAGQFVGKAHALDLGEIGRVFDHAVANDAGDGDADGIDVLLADCGQRISPARISTNSPPGSP